ncbi:MAG: 16S rRNA (guanine(527)-N(7))-methyltransferase RsmG [Phycisphaeraceae bacterium]|nr:16S rRNA (guanine(527)-N(7))-methyltransferase RsmG [Phycisphaerales bacterium]MCB9860873.1 16S rRNA (guanine(527)-N(7))-methyltransferase RsmG [Phycisphaeraceae bacterium]
MPERRNRTPSLKTEQSHTATMGALLHDGSIQPLVPTETFDSMVRDAQIELSDGEREKLGLFLAGLLKVNEVVNLTAIRDAETAWIKHIYDAVSLLPVFASLPETESMKIVDVGSGCGVPGIPLAICIPNAQMTLLESTGRKCAFLSAICSMLDLSNVSVAQQRAEDMGTSVARSKQDGSRRETFDVAVCRAVGRVAVALELMVPLVRVGGHLVLVKGQAADEELAEANHAMRTLTVDHLGTIDTPTGRIVVLEKRGRTPRQYPRKAGEPARNPLVPASYKQRGAQEDASA